MIAISINGALVPLEQASISVLDRGLLYGDGCFEVLRTWGGAATDLDAHLDRLFDTAGFLQLRTISHDELRAATERTIVAAGADSGDHRIRILLTRGPGGLGHRLAELGPGVAIVIVEPLPPQPEAISLAVVDFPLPRRAGRGHKTLAYLDHLLARELARAAGADEAVRLDAEGNAVEGATCNLFAVSGDTVITPPVDGGALPGIVRGRVLTLCSAAGLSTQTRPLAVHELRTAGELFVTSSLRGVVAVTQLDGQVRAAGPITARLAAAYHHAMRRSDL